MKRVALAVNVDHVATLRQARRTRYPDPVEAARAAEEAGAAGITVHLRTDRRHIQPADVRRLRAAVRGRLNLEMAASEEMLAAALDLAPHQVTLVPERPEEVTTEGGLDLVAREAEVAAAAGRLAAAGVAVSLFLDPDPAQLAPLARFPAGAVAGFEINTDAYSRFAAAGGAAEVAAETTRELERVVEMARLGGERGLRVFAGHGLTAANVGPIAAVPEIEELNVGHWLVSRAVLLGMAGAVREMLAAMASP
jgi:pyridoxine 5-phosphate synthase